MDDVRALQYLQNLKLGLSRCLQLLLLAFSVAKNKLPLFRLEVVSLPPSVLGPLGELLFKIGDGINFVKVLENLGLEVWAADLPLSDPKEPLFLVVSFKKLHADVAIT